MMNNKHFCLYPNIALRRHFPAGNYMFKVNNRNTGRRCVICSKLTLKTTERRHWHLPFSLFNYVLLRCLLVLIHNFSLVSNSNSAIQKNVSRSYKSLKLSHSFLSLSFYKKNALCFNVCSNAQWVPYSVVSFGFCFIR